MHPKRLQTGVSDYRHNDWTFARPLLQIHGNPLFLDADSRSEEVVAGRPFSPAVMTALANCAIGIWILPHGGEPFSMEAPFFQVYGISRQDLYPESFRLAFLEHYRRIPSVDPYLDLWSCNKG